MPKIAHLRKQGLYFRAVSQIMGEITNANVSWPTVTSVELTNDSSHLYIYLTFENNAQKSLEALENTKGFVRSQLASFVTDRKVPQIHFRLDNSSEQGRKIDQILIDIKNKEKDSKN